MSFRIILRTAYTSADAFVTDDPSMVGRQRGDVLLPGVFATEDAAKLELPSIIVRENAKRNPAVTYEDFDGEGLYTARLGGKLIAAHSNPCEVCKLVQSCDYYEGRCSILS